MKKTGFFLLVILMIFCQLMVQLYNNQGGFRMEEIKRVTKHVVEAMNRGDSRSFFSVISDEAVFFPPNEPPKKGDDLRRFMTQFLDQYSVHFDSYVDEKIISANDFVINHYAYEWTVTSKAGDGPRKGQGHGIRILKLQADGSWKIHYEIWSIYAQPDSMQK